MIFIKRAFDYLRKKIGKTILLTIIFMVIANFIIAGLLIQSASENAQENTRLTIGADIHYIMNYDKIYENYDKGTMSRREAEKLKQESGVVISEVMTENGAPTYKNINKVVDSDFVSTFYYSNLITATVELIEAYQIEKNASPSSTFNIILYGGDSPIDFADGEMKLISGELSTTATSVVISDEVATKNNLKVGDLLTVEYDDILSNTVDIEHQISGIYHTNQEISNVESSIFLPQNKLYIPITVLKTVGLSDMDLDNMIISQSTIRLKDPSNIDLYRVEILSGMTLEYGMLDANDDLYNSLVDPIESIGLITQIFVVSIIITGGFIVGLITALTINDRKSEIGILLAVGETKLKIVLQFILEVVVIAFVAFSLSLFTGQVLGENLSETLLDSEVFGEVEERPMQKFGKMFKTEDVSQATSMNIALNFKIVIQIFALGILLTVISTAIPTLYVMRFSPKQILTTRNS